MHSSLLSSFRLRNVNHFVVGFDVARRDGEQLVHSHAGSPQFCDSLRAKRMGYQAAAASARTFEFECDGGIFTV